MPTSRSSRAVPPTGTAPAALLAVVALVAALAGLLGTAGRTGATAAPSLVEAAGTRSTPVRTALAWRAGPAAVAWPGERGASAQAALSAAVLLAPVAEAGPSAVPPPVVLRVTVRPAAAAGTGGTDPALARSGRAATGRAPPAAAGV